jgi:hypothetical protein
MACLTAALAWLAPASAQDATALEIARGKVYHDANGNGNWDSDEAVISGVPVSNGRQVVRSDAAGRYELPVDDDEAIFVIKPRGWRTPLTRDQLPQFYYLHKPHGSPPLRYPGVPPTGPLPASIDFPLYPQEEPDTFQMILFGDTQARNLKEIGYIGNDAVTELIGTTASFGVTLGDIVFDDLSLFEPHNQTIAQLRIPWINVIGNHDLNTDARRRRDANESYERVYGPSYYSFDFGHVHFVVLDDCDWVVADESAPAHLAAAFGAEQLEFLRNDLALIPESRMVVLMMHIPITQAADREQVFRLIENRPLCLSIAGHTHTHEHHFLSAAAGWRGTEPHHHIVNVTVCGSWWSGQLDERGIPHALMTDGAPNGYSLLKFDGDRYELEFKAAGRPADYQMEISTQRRSAEGTAPITRVLANIFNATERAQVQWRVDDEPWLEMSRTLEPDPHYQAIYERERALAPPIEPALATPGICTHLWQATLPGDLAAGTHRLTVRAVEPHAGVVTGHRVIRVE